MRRTLYCYFSLFFIIFGCVGESLAIEKQVYDFESTSLDNNLTKHIDPDATEYAFQQMKSKQRAGCFSGRFELHSGDRSKDGERSELSEKDYLQNNLLLENKTAYYGFSILIPSSELNDCGAACGEWRNFMQWHVRSSESEWGHHPLLTLSLEDGKLSFILAIDPIEKKGWYEKIVSKQSFIANEWVDFVVQLNWSTNPEKGSIEIWKNGKSIAKRYGKIGHNYTDNKYEGVFWKFGVYRQPVMDIDIVYFDELKRGNSKSEVEAVDKECKAKTSFNGLLSLLLSEKKSLIYRPYYPSNPNPQSDTEQTVTLNENSWQRLYSNKETFCQMAVKSDNTVKTKFGQLVDDGAYGLLEWFDVQRGTSQAPIQNGAPFDVEQVFPEYNFSNCHNPGDNDDIWTCEVQIPGYRPYSPTYENPTSASENPVPLNDNSWQRLYTHEETFCQMAVKSDNTVKTKFGQLVNNGAYGLLEWFDVQRGTSQAPMQNGAPFDIEEVFPEYNFSNCHNPGDDNDIWTCKVQVPNYN